MSTLKETKVYSINDFLNWYERGELTLSPKYQRKSVWNSKAESYLIDTIVRGLPIPQVFLRQTIDTNLRKTSREVIDGQQRLSTIIKFISNEFPLMKSHNTDLGGFYYDDLSDDIKEAVLDYQIPVELIKTKEDSVVYDMFMRVNTNSYTLKAQELRNAKYWGDFKVLVYKLASRWRKFFIEYNVFKDNDLIRMNDAEYISSLLILLREGVVHDTGSKIDNYYKKYDNELPNLEENEILFDDIMTKIKNIFDNEFSNIKFFNKKNYIYTLFGFLLLSENKLNNDNFISERYQEVVPSQIFNAAQIRRKINEMESEMSREEDFQTENISRFLYLHKVRTTNEAERKERLVIFLNYVYGLSDIE